jgi:phage-related protein (TIGR01555 family)
MTTTITTGTRTLAQTRVDGWNNLLTGLGVPGRDKRLLTAYRASVGMGQAELEALFHGDDLVATVCGLPAEEMTREWIELTTPGDDEEGKTDPELARAVTQHLEVVGAQGAMAEGITWARLYGGSIVLLGADDGQDPTTPLREDAIRSLDWLTVLDRWDLTIVRRYEDPRGRRFGEPELYRINSTLTDTRGVALGDEVHASRVLRFDGAQTSRRRRRQNGGWCDSVIDRVYEVLRDFNAGFGGASALLADFAQAVFKIKDLAQMLSHDEDDLVRQRLELLDYARSSCRAVPLDAESEDFSRQVTPIAGLPELLDRMMLRLSAATRMPVTLLMGRAPAGLNATGESDIRTWYDHVAAQQERELRPRLERLIRLVMLAKTGPTRGREPQNWSFAFRPLWQLPEGEVAQVRKTQAETDAIYLDRGVLRPGEVASSRWGGDKWSMETVLDPEARQAAAEATGTTDPTSAPAPGAIGPEAGAEGAADPQTAFNGAQVSSMVEVVRAAIAGEIPRESAVAILSVAFPVSAEQALAMLGPEGFEPVKPDPPPAPPAFQGGTPGGPPPGKPEAGVAAAAPARADALEPDEIRRILEALRPTRLSFATEPTIRAILLEVGAAELERLAVTGSFNILNPKVVDHLVDYSNDRVVGINETTRDALRAQLVEGVREGEGVDKLSARIRAVMDDASQRRAKMIARTEMTRSSNWAALEAMGQSGVVEHKRWVRSYASHPRDAHIALDGKVLPLGEAFVSNGHRGQHPGGFGVASEDINCGCSVVAHIQLDAAERADDAGLGARRRLEEALERRLEEAVRDGFVAQLEDLLAALRRYGA